METPELTAEQVDYLVLLSDRLATKYPELNARIQRAVSMVRAGNVQLRGDELAAVRNGGDVPYEVTLDGCSCEDFVRGNAPRGMCKHRLAVHLLRQTCDHFDPNKAESSKPAAGNSEGMPLGESGGEEGKKPASPYVYPEPRFWVRGDRRQVNTKERQVIDGLHSEAEAKCKGAYESLPAEVWGCIVHLPRNHKVPGKEDVFVSLRTPYLTVAGRLILLRAKRQPKEIVSEFFTLGERTLCKAVVKVGQCSATGTAEVIEGDYGPTSTNPYEVAETSAIGRALGNLGIGLIGGIASADEVMNAQARAAAKDDAQQAA